MGNNEQLRNILVAVDIQNDFINGSLPVSEGDQVIEPINKIAATIRNSGGAVTFTRDWHPSTTPHFNTWPVHCVEATEGAAFHEQLEIEDSDIIISKGMELTDGYSGWEGIAGNETGFGSTAHDGSTLEAIITPRSPEEKVRVFIGGLATDYCVKATTLDVAHHFVEDKRVAVYLLRDAIRAVNLQPNDGDDALEAMREAKTIALTSEEAQALIRKGF